MKIQNKIEGGEWSRGGGEGGSGLGGQVGCERRFEILVKIKKKLGGGGRGEGRDWGGVVRVYVIEELKFLGKFTKKSLGGGVGSGGGGGGGSGWGSGWM